MLRVGHLPTVSLFGLCTYFRRQQSEIHFPRWCDIGKLMSKNYSVGILVWFLNYFGVREADLSVLKNIKFPPITHLRFVLSNLTLNVECRSHVTNLAGSSSMLSSNRTFPTLMYILASVSKHHAAYRYRERFSRTASQDKVDGFFFFVHPKCVRPIYLDVREQNETGMHILPNEMHNFRNDVPCNLLRAFAVFLQNSINGLWYTRNILIMVLRTVNFIMGQLLENWSWHYVAGSSLDEAIGFFFFRLT